MVSGSSNSPIDTLLEKNAKMAQSSKNNSRVASENVQPDDAEWYKLTRSKRFGDEFLPSCKLQIRDNAIENSMEIENDTNDKCDDEGVIEGLNYLGLTLRNDARTARTSSTSTSTSLPSTSTSSSSPSLTSLPLASSSNSTRESSSKSSSKLSWKTSMKSSLKPSSKRKSRPPQKLEGPIDDFMFKQAHKYPCDYCRRTFYDKLIFRRHTLKHLPRVRWCGNCHRAFTTREAYKRHRACFCKTKKY